MAAVTSCENTLLTSVLETVYKYENVHLVRRHVKMESLNVFLLTIL